MYVWPEVYMSERSAKARRLRRKYETDRVGSPGPQTVSLGGHHQHLGNRTQGTKSGTPVDSGTSASGSWNLLRPRGSLFLPTRAPPGAGGPQTRAHALWPSQLVRCSACRRGSPGNSPSRPPSDILAGPIQAEERSVLIKASVPMLIIK